MKSVISLIILTLSTQAFAEKKICVAANDIRFDRKRAVYVLSPSDFLWDSPPTLLNPTSSQAAEKLKEILNPASFDSFKEKKICVYGTNLIVDEKVVSFLTYKVEASNWFQEARIDK